MVHSHNVHCYKKESEKKNEENLYILLWKDFQDSLGDQSQCRAVHIVFYFLYLKKVEVRI